MVSVVRLLADGRVSLKMYTGVAQLVEHWSPKPGVGSSSLSSRAKSKY
jgi:hypothetical protein